MKSLIVITAALLLDAASTSIAPRPAEGGPSIATGDSKSGGNEAAPNSNALPIQLVDNSEEERSARQREREAEQREKASLEAEKASAEAAVSQAKLSAYALGISAAGTLFVIIALLLSAAANRTANRSLAHAHKVSMSELRAYLGVESVLAAPAGNNGMAAKVTFRNFGQTPARNVNLRIGSWIGPFPLLSPQGGPDPIEQHPSPIINPTQIGEGFASFDDPDFRSKLISGDFAYYVYGEICYTDIFGTPQSVSFSYRGTGDLALRGNMSPCVDGNSAT